MVQLSHPYMTTGKTIALTIQTFVSKVMSAEKKKKKKPFHRYVYKTKHSIYRIQHPLGVLEQILQR